MTGLVLPPSRSQISSAELRHRWGFNDHRRDILDEFEKFLRLISKLVTIQAYWVSGTFISDKEHPSDIDVVLVIDQERLDNLGSGARLAVTPTGFKKLASRQSLRVDAYLLPWKVRPSVSYDVADRPYLEARGYWDDFWMRDRSVPKGATPERLCAMPRKGYVEVIADGFK